MKTHLKAKHHTEFSKYTKFLEDLKVRNEKRVRESDCDTIPTSVGNKKQKIELFQQTISGFTENTKIWDVNSSKAKEFHKDVFEYLVEDMIPWSTVQDRSFLRMYKKRFPNFNLGTPRYYASMLDPAYIKIKSNLKEIMKSDNSESFVISLDCWSQYHNGYLGINCHYIDTE